MSWTELPKGSFTGIDWAKPGATTGADPYLVWAEADQFAGYGGKQPRWLPIAIELSPGVSIAQFIAAGSPLWLHVPPVYTTSAAPEGLRFCTARVKPAFFKHIRPGGSLHALVQRLEMGLPAGRHTDDPTAPSAAPPGAAPVLLKGKVIGQIDGGLAFANTRFLKNGKARTQYFWRQDGEGVGSTPAGLGYGHELTAAQINQAMQQNTYNGMVDEGAVYQQFKLTALQRLLNHGTQVLDLACGPRTLPAQVSNLPPTFDAPPSWALADDDASRADIVSVQLDWDTIRDTSGGAMGVHILDGLMYIMSRCALTAKIAVNLSWGTLAGPHDGSSLLEAAMDQLITLCGKRLQIILPVSNSYQWRTHANATLLKNERVTLNWRGQPDDLSQNFLELWLPAEATGIKIEITPPGRATLPALLFGESRMWLADGIQPLCALIYPKAVATGQNGTCALIAVAPTFSFDPGVATAPSGAWQVRLTNTHAGAVTVDAYVERDDEVLAHHTGIRQSHLEDALYDMQALVDDPTNPTPIRRSGNFNSIATGSKTVSVGGTRIAGSKWANYSPRKPDPDHARPTRPGVVKVPNTQAFSDENAALTGVRGASTRSGSAVRLVGTSDAAPQVTRKVLNAM